MSLRLLPETLLIIAYCSHEWQAKVQALTLLSIECVVLQAVIVSLLSRTEKTLTLQPSYSISIYESPHIPGLPFSTQR